MKNLINRIFLVISCCFLVAIQVFCIYWIWEYSVTAAYISGWNAKECRLDSTLPFGDLEDYSVATFVYPGHAS